MEGANFKSIFLHEKVLIVPRCAVLNRSSFLLINFIHPVCMTYLVKVSKSQKKFFLKLHCPKNERNITQNSALESKKWLNQKYKGILLN